MSSSTFAQRGSALESAEARFLSTCLSYALDTGWLTPSDMCEEFPPEILMMALEQASELRARLLVDATGVHERVALRKSTGTAAEDLRLALDEGLCDADRLLEIVTVDEWVRYLDSRRLWQLLTRDQFWLDTGERARERMAQMLGTSVQQRLLELPALLRAASPERLASDLPRELVEDVMVRALNAGLSGQVFDPESFVELIPLATWLQYIPLAHFWETVISEVVVPRAGLAAPTSPPRASVAPASNRVPGKTKKTVARKPAAREPASREPVRSTSKAPSMGAFLSSLSESGRAAMSPEEKQARARAVQLLKKFDRLPASVEQLSTPALLGLETMYTELSKTRTEEEKEECIVDAFPNEHLLEEALLPIAVLLDPRLSEQELVRRGADASSLVALVLFEERRRVTRSQSIPPAAPSAALPVTTQAQGSAAASGQMVRSVHQVPPSPQVPRISDSVPPPPLSGINQSTMKQAAAEQAVPASSVPPRPPSQRASSLPPPLPAHYRTGN